MNTINYDPFLGPEEVRRDVVRLSKSAFYGANGLARRLPFVQLSQRRKGVRRSVLEQFLLQQTRVGE